MIGDPEMVAAYRDAFREAKARTVTFTRVSGVAPNATTASATVTAIVRNYSGAASGGAGSTGAITQGNRSLIVLADDLNDEGFPLPLQKHDKVTLTDTGEMLDVQQVDPFKRAAAGAIELQALGVR